MRLRSTWLTAALGLLALWAPGIRAQATARLSVAADSTSLAIVEAYFTAYNAHDVEGVLRLLDPDFVWLSLTGDSITVEVRGITAVRSSLDGYFRQLPSARSEAEVVSALGPWVSVRERAHWESPSGHRSQASMSVYEVRNGLLRRVWYYPVVR